MNFRHSLVAIVLVLTFALASCSSPVSYVKPLEWSADSLRLATISASAPALAGHRIFLDPGHGGDDRVNRGPAQEAIEADVNLRVGLALRNLLQGAGATVYMSRDHDTTVGLRERVRLAAASGAEIFISLHHNATGTGDNVTNYAAVYYHSREGLPGYHPSTHDLARYIERDMSYAMRNPPPPFSGTFDGTLSDYDIYPNSGFAVLRDNPLPAVLIEASFFTHPPEERRLAVQEFNQIEAWGIFLGLSKYFRAGIPAITWLSDTLSTIPRPAVRMAVTPARSMNPSSFQLYLDGRLQRNGLASHDTTFLWTPPADLLSGVHTVAAVVENAAGNHSWPFRRPLHIMLPAVTVTASLSPDVIPAGAIVPVRVTARAIDAQHRPVADGSSMMIQGRGIPDTLRSTLNGGTMCTLFAPPSNDTLRITVSSGSSEAAGTAPRLSGLQCLSGIVTAAPSGPALAGTVVALSPDPVTRFSRSRDTTIEDGRYILTTPLSGTRMLSIHHAGYFTVRDSVDVAGIQLQHNISLEAIAGQALFGDFYLLDARYGGTETGEVNSSGLRASDVNLIITRRLADLLNAAGARAVMMREDDSDIAEPERARRSAGFPSGHYVRIDASTPSPRLGATVYPSVENRAFAEKVVGMMAQWAGLDTIPVEGSHDQFHRDVAMSTTTLLLPSVNTGYYTSMEQAADRLAWSIFAGILRAKGFDASPVLYQATSPGGAPLPMARVLFHNTFVRTTDERGIVTFPPLAPHPVLSIEGDPHAIVTQVPTTR